MPRADSRTSSSTSATPTYVFVTIGGTASATIAMNAGVELHDLQQAFGLADADPAHREEEQRERRKRATDVGDVDRDAASVPQVSDDQADRQRDERGEQRSTPP